MWIQRLALVVMYTVIGVIGITAQEGDSIVFERRYDDTYSTIFKVDLESPELQQLIGRDWEEQILTRSVVTTQDMPIITLLVSEDSASDSREIWTLNIETGNATAHGTCLCLYASMSNDGTWLLVEELANPQDSIPQISIKNIETGQQKILQNGSERNRIPILYESNAHWLINGNQVIFRSEFYDDDTVYVHINEYDLKNDEISILARCKLINCPLLLSPNGEVAFAFESLSEEVELHTLGTVILSDTRFNSRFDRHPEHAIQLQQFADWHPNSRQFVMIEKWKNPQANDTITDIVLYDIDGNAKVLVHFPDTVSITELQLNHDGTLMMYRVDNRTTYEISFIVHNLDTGEQIMMPMDGSFPQWVKR